MEQTVNRRRWQRFPFDASVRVVVDQSAEITVVDARGVRFSEGGICLFAAANLPVGSQVKVESGGQECPAPHDLLGGRKTAIAELGA